MKPSSKEPGIKTVVGQVRLKQVSGWFAADESFARALELLSDGAFRLFVRKMFLRLSCGKRNFGPADEKFAEELAQAGVLLAVVEDALLLGEARKYLSWLNHGASAPIGSLEYFRPLIEEVQQQPLPAAYKEYLRASTKQFARRWSKNAGLKAQYADTKSRTFATSAGAKK